MQDDKQYLEKLHSKSITPNDIIRGAVKEATSSGIQNKRRIIAGEISEVYDIGLLNGQHIIVRIARGESEQYEQERWALKECKKVGLDQKLMLKVFEILREKIKLVADIQPSLSHEDFLPRHIMVNENDQITGILNWGDIRGDYPIDDFAKWDYYAGKIPIEWLKEGYANKSLFDSDFEELLHLVKLNRGLGVLEWYYKQKYPQRIKKAKSELIKDLQYFSSQSFFT